MALIKFGGGITAMSGSIAGNTFARNRFGYYGRARTKPVNPRSSGQAMMRSSLAYLTENWHDALNDDQRIAWGTYAQAISMKNRLGEAIKLTGFNHYIRSNGIRLQNGKPIVNDGPEDLSLPPTDAGFAITAVPTTQKISVAYTNHPTFDWPGDTGSFLAIYMGRPQLATRNFFAGPWRLSGVVLGNTASPPASPQLIDAIFTLVGGQKIWAYARIVDANGRLSGKFMDDCVVPAAGTILTVAGTLAPDSTGEFVLGGMLAGYAWYRRLDGAYHIWYNPDDTKSYISVLLGDKGVAYWSKTGAPIAGSYAHGGTATGDATVTSN
jgi:hypothetical protein